MLIESEGGWVADGLALYNDFRARAEAGCIVSTEARGVVASSAVLAFLAGDTRRMRNGTQLMTHDVMGGGCIFGTSAEILDWAKDAASGVDASQATLASVYQERTGATEKKAAGYLKGTNWFTPAEAVDAGFATEVVKAGINQVSPQELKNAARVFASWRTGYLRRGA